MELLDLKPSYTTEEIDRPGCFRSLSSQTKQHSGRANREKGGGGGEGEGESAEYSMIICVEARPCLDRALAPEGAAN